MTDGYSEAIEHSRRNQGTELTKRDSGGLIARGLADLQQLRAEPTAEECFQRGLAAQYEQGRGVPQDDEQAVYVVSAGRRARSCVRPCHAPLRTSCYRPSGLLSRSF